MYLRIKMHRAWQTPLTSFDIHANDNDLATAGFIHFCHTVPKKRKGMKSMQRLHAATCFAMKRRHPLSFLQPPSVVLSYPSAGLSSHGAEHVASLIHKHVLKARIQACLFDDFALTPVLRIVCIFVIVISKLFGLPNALGQSCTQKGKLGTASLN